MGLDSVGEFELDTCWLVDGCDDFEAVVDGRLLECEVAAVDPLAAVLGQDLELGLQVHWLVGDHCQLEGRLFGSGGAFAVVEHLDDGLGEAVVELVYAPHVQSQALAVVVLGEGQRELDGLLVLLPGLQLEGARFFTRVVVSLGNQLVSPVYLLIEGDLENGLAEGYSLGLEGYWDLDLLVVGQVRLGRLEEGREWRVCLSVFEGDVEGQSLVERIAESEGLTNLLPNEDCHFLDFWFELRQSVAAEVVRPLGILVAGEVDLAFLHLKRRGAVEQAEAELGPWRHLEALLFREEDGGVGAARGDIHGSVVGILKLYFFPVGLAQLDLEGF